MGPTRKVFPTSGHQRCWVHKMRNVLDKVPDKAHDKVSDHLRLMYHAKPYKEAQSLKKDFIEHYQNYHLKAVSSLLEAGEALFTSFHFPGHHWIHLKTTNPIESLFAPVRLRTRAARHIRTRMATVCLVFRILKTSQKRLRRIRGYKLVVDTVDALQSRSLKIGIAA